MNGIIKRWFIKMNAEQLINECDTQKFNPKQFRNEINISWLINDVKKQYEEQNDWIYFKCFFIRSSA